MGYGARTTTLGPLGLTSASSYCPFSPLMAFFSKEKQKTARGWGSGCNWRCMGCHVNADIACHATQLLHHKLQYNIFTLSHETVHQRSLLFLSKFAITAFAQALNVLSGPITFFHTVLLTPSCVCKKFNKND